MSLVHTLGDGYFFSRIQSIIFIRRLVIMKLRRLGLIQDDHLVVGLNIITCNLVILG